MSIRERLEIAILAEVGGKPAFAYAQYGECSAAVKLPPDGTLDALQKKRAVIDASLRGEVDAPGEEWLEIYSRELGSYLLRDEIREMYLDARPRGIRIELTINEATLQSLPWEYMCCDDDAAAPNRNRAVSRVIPQRRRSHITRDQRRDSLGILLALASPINGAPVPTEELKERITEVFNRRIVNATGASVHIDIIEATSSLALTRKLAGRERRYDIFHFLGHGDVVKGEGVLVFHGKEAGQTHQVDGQRLAGLLSGYDIRLAILTACDSAVGGLATPFANIAASLVSQHIPAVIGNQMPITTDSVAAFAAAVYSELLSSGDLDSAVSNGRVTMFGELADGKRAPVEWGIPVLYRQRNATRILDASMPRGLDG